jgi:hypothetical protein
VTYITERKETKILTLQDLIMNRKIILYEKNQFNIIYSISISGQIRFLTSVISLLIVNIKIIDAKA